ncbi:AtpZ/AtpI family protein [Oscillatoria amoena NRMC-F 0135]|jgi:F0F1-type ATP synthase assembly protein I|nr:AtpZ/AtpI family protein [Oscillatoria amoena NRMC-F 0135]
MASEHRDPSPERKPKPYNSYLKYSSLALQLLVTIGLFAWLGYVLDGWLNLKYPVFLIVFVFVAFAGMMYQLYKSIDKS